MKYYIADKSKLAESGLGSEPWRKCRDGLVLINETEARKAFGPQIPDWVEETTHDGAVDFLNRKLS